MKLVEQHIIERGDPRYAVIDATAFASKNLYNAALYVLRQTYIFEGKYLSYTQMDKRMQSHEAYKALPAKVAQKVLDQLDKNWQAFFEARERYAKDPSTFQGRPGLPKYKHKTRGATCSSTQSKPSARRASSRVSSSPQSCRSMSGRNSSASIKCVLSPGRAITWWKWFTRKPCSKPR